MPSTQESRANKARRTYRGSIALVAFLIAFCLSSRQSTPAAAAQGPISEQELAARRARIREFFQARLQRMKIIATTVTPSGQTLDWIRPESQTPDGKLAQPPAAFPDSAATPPNTDLAQTEVELYPHTRGPAGTVPIVRFDVEKYLASVKVPPADPKDVIRGMYPPRPAPNGNYYVGWKLEETNWGSGGMINIWDTPGPVSPEASIAQLNVSGGTYGTATMPATLQTIEAGKIEKEPITGDALPHFFVYYTTNAYSNAGDWEGGYNTYVSGFIQYLFSRAPNMVITSSVQGGRQVDLGVTIHYDQGNWWVGFNSQWVGYYPYCKGGMLPPCRDYPDPDNPNGPLLPGGPLFSSSGLRDSAARLDWYGEVHNPFAPTST